MKKLHRLAFVTLVSISLMACFIGCELFWANTSDISPRFGALRGRVEKNPSPDAIVGMWHRGGHKGYEGTRVSLLFRGNGAGMLKDNPVESAYGNLRATVHAADNYGNKEPVSFTYQYAGNGSWVDSLGATYWIANGSLLRQAKGMGVDSNYLMEGVIRDVFERVE